MLNLACETIYEMYSTLRQKKNENISSISSIKARKIMYDRERDLLIRIK